MVIFYIKQVLFGMEIHSYDRFDSVVGAEQGTRGGHKQPGRAMGAELYEGPLEAPVGL